MTRIEQAFLLYFAKICALGGAEGARRAPTVGCAPMAWTAAFLLRQPIPPISRQAFPTAVSHFVICFLLSVMFVFSPLFFSALTSTGEMGDIADERTDGHTHTQLEIGGGFARFALHAGFRNGVARIDALS